MTHEEFVKSIINDTDSQGRLKSRERNDLEYKKSFNQKNWAKYAKIMASYSNNRGGYILFGINDNPRIIDGVNEEFNDFQQETLTAYLNALFSPEILWEPGIVEFEKFKIGYIYTFESINKPVIALKNENSEKICSGDVFYRYRGRSEKIKYPEMIKLIDERANKERERILKLMEAIRNSNTTNLGIVNYNNGKFSTPYGVDITVDKKIVVQILKKAKYIRSGQFDETNGNPVLKVSGNIDLTEEVPVPDIELDIQYPFLQKQLAEKLNITTTCLYALIWKYDMKKQKKYHMEISTTSTGKNKSHKFSDIALQFLAEEINKHKDDSNWLESIRKEHQAFKNEHNSIKK